MKPLVLPSYQYCADLIEKDDDLTPLERFIYDNEPAWGDEEWRKSLRMAILEAIADVTGSAQ